MSKIQRFVQLSPTGEIQIKERPVPEVGPNEVLVRVQSSLLSPGTELHHINARLEDTTEFAEPRSMGYQNAGDIEQVGESVDSVAPGDRVACMGTGYALHANYAVVPEKLCVPLPDGVSYDQGAFNHLAATALHGIRRAKITVGENLVVFGLGLVGQLTAQFAQVAGGHVVGVDHHQGRAEMARQSGVAEALVATDEDVVTEIRDCIGDPGLDCGFICYDGNGTETMENITKLSRCWPDGHETARIVILGHVNISFRLPTDYGNIDIRPASRVGPGYHDEDYEHGQGYPETLVRWDTQQNLRESVNRINMGDLDVDSLITNRYSLSEAPPAYQLLRDSPNDTLGILLNPE